MKEAYELMHALRVDIASEEALAEQLARLAEATHDNDKINFATSLRGLMRNCRVRVMEMRAQLAALHEQFDNPVP